MTYPCGGTTWPERDAIERVNVELDLGLSNSDLHELAKAASEYRLSTVRAQAARIEELTHEDRDVAFAVFERVDGLFDGALKKMVKFRDSCDAATPERHAIQTCIGHLANLNSKVLKMMENWPDD